MKKLFILLFPIFLFADFMSVTFGKAQEDIKITRLGYIVDFNKTLTKYSCGKITGYYEVSINNWYQIEHNEKIYAIAFSPVFIYQSNNRIGGFSPFVEAGIGLSYLSDTKIMHRDMGSYYHFEDRIGFGLQNKTTKLFLRYMHYSNANIDTPNEGIDIYAISIAYKF